MKSFTSLRQLLFAITIFALSAIAANYSISAAPTASDHYKTAVSLQKQRNLQGAIEELNLAIALDPSNATYLTALGMAFIETENFTAAIDQLNKALKAQPDMPEAASGLGVCYNALGEYEKSIEAFTQALTRIKPDTRDAAVLHNNIGQNYYILKEYAKSEHELLEALKIQPNLLTALINLGNVYTEQGFFETALKYHKQAVEAAPNYPLARNNLAFAYYKTNKIDDAIAEMQKVLEIDPGNTQFTKNYEFLKQEKKRIQSDYYSEGPLAGLPKQIKLKDKQPTPPAEPQNQPEQSPAPSENTEVASTPAETTPAPTEQPEPPAPTPETTPASPAQPDAEPIPPTPEQPATPLTPETPAPVETVVTEQPATPSIECPKDNLENCPEGCVVCPPCAICSSIACMPKEFCAEMGIGRDWYNEIKTRIASTQPAPAPQPQTETAVATPAPEPPIPTDASPAPAEIAVAPSNAPTVPLSETIIVEKKKKTKKEIKAEQAVKAKERESKRKDVKTPPLDTVQLADLYYRGAKYNIDTNDYHHAERDIDRALELYPTNDRFRLVKAIIDLHTSDPVNALESFKSIIANNPQDAVAHAFKGLADERMNRFDEAEQEFRIALDLDPIYGCAAANIGLLLMKKGDCDGAIEMFHRASDYGCQRPEVTNNIAVCRLFNGDPDVALELSYKALMTAPDNPVIRSNFNYIADKTGYSDRPVELPRLPKEDSFAKLDNNNISIHPSQLTPVQPLSVYDMVKTYYKPKTVVIVPFANPKGTAAWKPAPGDEKTRVLADAITATGKFIVITADNPHASLRDLEKDYGADIIISGNPGTAAVDTVTNTRFHGIKGKDFMRGTSKADVTITAIPTREIIYDGTVTGTSDLEKAYIDMTPRESSSLRTRSFENLADNVAAILVQHYDLNGKPSSDHIKGTSKKQLPRIPAALLLRK